MNKQDIAFQELDMKYMELEEQSRKLVKLLKEYQKLSTKLVPYYKRQLKWGYIVIQNNIVSKLVKESEGE